MNLSWVRFTSLAIVAMGAAAVQAGPLDIHRDDGVRVTFLNDLRSDYSERGDRFWVKVDKDPDLPPETTLGGVITRIHPANPYRAASMDLKFESMRLPNGETFRIDAVPTPYSSQRFQRGADGRLVAAYKPGDEAAYGFAGTVGGLILGGIGHRPIKGAIIGGLIGSIAGAFDRKANENVVVRKGEKMIALFVRDVRSTAGADDEAGWRRREDNRGGRRRDPGDRSRTPVVQVDGRTLPFDGPAPYRDGDQVMAPLEYTADQLNLAATVHDDGTVAIDGPDETEFLKIGSTYCRCAGNSRPLPHKLEARDGVVYAPLEAFTRVCSYTITSDGRRVGS